MRRFAGWERKWLLQAMLMTGATPRAHPHGGLDGAVVYNHMLYAVDHPQAGLLDIEERIIHELIPDKAARALFGTVDEATFRKAVEDA